MRSRSQRMQSHRTNERRRELACSRSGWVPFRFAAPALLALIWILGASADALAQQTFVVTRLDDPAPDGCAIGDCSLREAIIAANADVAADTITFDNLAGSPDMYQLTIAGLGEDLAATGDLDITQPLTIQGNAAGETIIQAGPTPAMGIDRVFHVVAAVAVTFENVTIRHGTLAAANGGGIFSAVASNITVSNGVVTDNQALSGGGIFVSSVGSQLTLTSAVVSGNSVVVTGGAGPGGGIMCIDCTLNATGSTVSGNIANAPGNNDSGGGVAITGNSLATISTSRITNNDSGNQGGGVFLFDTSAATITSTSITGNVGGAGGNIGDGIAVGGTASLMVSLSRFHNNGTGIARAAAAPPVTAINNWWGCDGLPGAVGCDAVVNLNPPEFDPRIDLRLTAAPPVIPQNGTSTLTADLKQNSALTAFSPAEIAAIDAAFQGISINFAPAPNMVPVMAPIANGMAMTTFTDTSLVVPATVITSATLDNGTQTANVSVVALPTLTINDVTMVEGDAGITNFVFTVMRSHNNTALSVQYETADGTANAPGDYTAVVGGTVSFPAGGTFTQTITVQVNGDLVVEADETFFVNLRDPVDADITTIPPADPQGMGTILNDDAASIAINDPAAVNEAIGMITFNVTLTGAVQGGLTVDFMTVDGTATVADNDYQDTNSGAIGVLTFAGNDQEMHTITVPVVDDAKVELDETLFVNIAQAGGLMVTVADGQGQGTILTDDQAGISINNVTLSEGDAGTTQFTFTVTLDAEVDVPVQIPFTTQDGSATTADNDYVPRTAQLLTFPVGMANQTQNIVVDVNGDTKVEPNETFNVALTGINAMGREMNGNILITQQPGVGTITNDDAATLSINDPAGVNESVGGITFTVTLSDAVQGGLTVDFATANGTATLADNDYVTAMNTLTFTGTAGETQPILVTVNDDAKVEPDETFFVNLSNLQAGGLATVTIADGQGMGTILNDDAAALSIDNVSMVEGAGVFQFTVTLSGAVQDGVMVDFTTNDGTALEGDNDYVGTTNTLNFIGTAGETQPIPVTVNNDAKVELNEVFTVDLSNLQASSPAVTIANGQGVGTIQNDDQAQIQIFDVTHNEGNSGTTNYAFSAILSQAVDVAVAVDFTTEDNSATTGDNDYAVQNGTILFDGNANETEIINVTVNGDTQVELDEFFVVRLTNIQAGTRDVVFANAVAAGNIVNDDSASLSIDDVSVNEGMTGDMPVLTFTVTLSADLFAPLTVDFDSADGTATAGSDYTANSNTLNFAGMAGEQQTIDIIVTGDDTAEPDETLLVDLSNIQTTAPNVGFAKQQGTGTIINDDMASLSIDDVSMVEAARVFQFTVTLSDAVQGGLTVDFATADGTALQADGDYVTAANMLVFAGNAGETQPVLVTVNDDAKVEPDESFFVNLSNLQAGGLASVTIADGQGLGTIQNDDAANLSIDDVSMAEGAGVFQFTVTLSGAVQDGVMVDFMTADGTALESDNDYIGTTNTLNFIGTAGETQPILVTVNDDAKVELDETFFVNISQSGGLTVTIADGQGMGTIGNDDAATLSIADVMMDEGSGGGTTTFSFGVTLDAALGQSVTVDFSTQDDTATTADNDYAAASGTLTFNGPAETQTIAVAVTADDKVEPTETFLVNLLNLQAGGLDVTVTDSQAQGTIVTDDLSTTLSIDDVTINEGPLGTPSNFRFTVTLSAAVASAVSVDFATADITATTADGDYTQTGSTLNFTGTAGETRFIDVTVTGDNKVESNETFAVNLSNPQAGGLTVTFAKQQGIGTIVNDDGAASLSINHVTLDEGGAGSSTIFNFTVTLDKQVGGPLSLDFATANGSAKTGNNDYTPTNSTLMFTGMAGEQHLIPVTVVGDNVAELDETFFVNLSNLQAGTLPVGFANQQGIGTILNDDDVGACGFPNNLVLDGQVLSGAETVVACQTITAGPSLQILSSANVILRAGTSVTLANGFFVEAGAVVTVEIDPSLSVP